MRTHRNPDQVYFRTLDITMNGSEAYKTIRNHNGLIGYRKDIVRIDNR